MDESTKRRWDVAIGITAPVIAVGGLILGALQFSEKISEDARLDFERRLWLADQEACIKLADRVGPVMASIGPTDSEIDIERLAETASAFEVSYWGPVLLLDDKEIEDAAIRFRDSLSLFQRGYVQSFVVKRAATKLVLACGDALRKSAPDGEEIADEQNAE